MITASLPVFRKQKSRKMNIYVKSVSESQVAAMDALSEKLVICSDHATEEEDQGKNLAQTRVIQ